MLIPDFYIIQDFESNENQISAEIKLNPKHSIYDGHFPGQPVVPGVVQLQIIKELIEKVLEKKLSLSEMAFAKFLISVLPHQNLILTLKASYKNLGEEINFSATISSEETTFTKVKGILVLR